MCLDLRCQGLFSMVSNSSIRFRNCGTHDGIQGAQEFVLLGIYNTLKLGNLTHKVTTPQIKKLCGWCEHKAASTYRPLGSICTSQSPSISPAFPYECFSMCPYQIFDCCFLNKNGNRSSLLVAAFATEKSSMWMHLLRELRGLCAGVLGV